MSITRIIGGSLTKTAIGNIEIHAADGDLTLYAAKNNSWHGEEEGIFYHDYEPPHPDNSLSNEKIIHLNLFFDGTQNNKTNTEAGRDHENSNHKDDSYTNDYSNVARGFDAVDPTVENQIRVYIEGIGTENLESETTFFGDVPNNSGIPFGDGNRGVKAKVTKGCIEAVAALKKAKKKVATLKINVYGFSRGATAARHFLHVATNPAKTNKPMLSDIEHAMPPYGFKTTSYLKTKESDELVKKHGYFGACLAEAEIFPENIIFNFVGIYDTVAAYGLDHRGKNIPGTNISIIDNDTKELGLDAVNRAVFVLQFAADDEHRDNFDLTNIKSAGINGLEFILPGVHSDIGGCYIENDTETVDLFCETYFYHGCKKFKTILEEEGWYIPEQLKIVHSYTNDFTQQIPEKFEDKTSGYYGLVGTRKLHNSYDKVSLNQMFYYSDCFDVKYSINMLNRHQIENPFLLNVYYQLRDYMNACTKLRNQYVERYNRGENIQSEYLTAVTKIQYQDFIVPEDLKKLRNEYLHWSSSATKFGYGPKIGGVKNGAERNRNIQYG